MKATDIKQRLDCHQVAAALGLERPHGRGNYKSPHHPDSSPSLSVFGEGRAFKDFSADGEDGSHGSCIDLVMWVQGCGFVEALEWLHDAFSLPQDPPPETLTQAPRHERTLVEKVADDVLRHDPAPLLEYLSGERAIPEAVVQRAIKARAVGWNVWTSPKVAPGEPQHGGPGAAFVTRTLNPGHVVAVDTRYADPALNGGVKTQTVGAKEGHPWTLDARALARARRVFVVESPVNALSVEALDLPGAAALAVRGTNVAAIDWRFLVGKRAVLALDWDSPDHRGRCAGQESAWRLLELLTALNVPAQLIDQLPWTDAGWNDVNDVLRDGGSAALREALGRLEPWAISGLPGTLDGVPMRPRVYLPSHDFARYWRYRVKPDFTVAVTTRRDADGNEQDHEEDLAGFRVAALTRVAVASATSVMSGDADAQPRTVYSVSVQTPRHGDRLHRRVIDDERLHNVGEWQKIGPVFKPAPFLRLVNILERSADLGAREAINFVGLAWQDGKLRVNEGPDCYFSDAERQCPYHNLQFPGGTPADGRRVLAAYQDTFRHNAAALLLVWGLGAHLKAVLGFWPHLVLQADKGAGKSVLTKRLERTLGMTVFGGQSIQTEFRLLTSVSHTSQPVGWEEISARKQQVIDAAVAMLQESYQFTVTRRGADLTEYLMSAPVLLAGEDVPVTSLTQKTVRTDLTGRKGPLLPQDLPKFPLLQWLQWLAAQDPARLRERFARCQQRLADLCRASSEDDGARRMRDNYAALLTGWWLLTEFLEVDPGQGGLPGDLAAAMNDHIADTAHDREPWIWIIERLLGEMARGNYRFPWRVGSAGEPAQECLVIRPAHVMQHFSQDLGQKDFFAALPVKSARALKRQLLRADVVAQEDTELRLNGQRHGHMLALSTAALAQYGLHVPTPEPDGEFAP